MSDPVSPLSTLRSAFAALSLLGLAGAPLAQESAARPNVVVILADDLGYQDLGCYGHPELRTPVLDRLAAQGVRLTDYHAGATVCTPSRMALLSGCYPSRVGWTRGVLGYGMELDQGLSAEVPTLAELFQAAGYATGLSGKWHLGHAPEQRPHRRGFDEATYLALSNNQTTQLWRGDEVVQDPFENRLLSEQLTQEAVRFVRAHAQEPFFLYLPFTAPHFPVEAHPDWEQRSSHGTYGDVVEELDARVGELLAVLEELELSERTLVVFTSDNGPNPREAASSLPFRGEKWSALEGGTRVPALFAWPGVLPAGARCDSLVSALDLLPTLCAAAGVRRPAQPRIDGLNVWDELLGRAQAPVRSELLYWHGMEPEPQAIRVGDWKLFFDREHALKGSGTARATPAQRERIAPYRAALDPEGEDPPFLFELSSDPGETRDRSEEFPERVAALRARADELLAELRASSLMRPEEPAPADER